MSPKWPSDCSGTMVPLWRKGNWAREVMFFYAERLPAGKCQVVRFIARLPDARLGKAEIGKLENIWREKWFHLLRTTYKGSFNAGS